MCEVFVSLDTGIGGLAVRADDNCSSGIVSIAMDLSVSEKITVFPFRRRELSSNLATDEGVSCGCVDAISCFPCIPTSFCSTCLVLSFVVCGLSMGEFTGCLGDKRFTVGCAESALLTNLSLTDFYKYNYYTTMPVQNTLALTISL